jgi:hypothetical protein
MSIKQEALAAIQNHVDDKAIKYTTTITTLSEEYDTELTAIVEVLEDEFEVELDEEMVIEAETIGELCSAVVRATKLAAEA